MSKPQRKKEMNQDLFSPTNTPAQNEQPATGASDISVLEDFYVKSRDAIAARYNELIESNDYIPVLRVVNGTNDVVLNQAKVGSAIFSSIHKNQLHNHKHYNCNACRDAFRALYQVWFLDKNGKPHSPILEVAKEFGVSIPALVPATDKEIKITYRLLRGASKIMANAETENDGVKFTHYYGFTEEQIECLNAMGMPDLLNARNIAAVCDVIDGGLDPETVYRAISAETKTEVGLQGLKHIKEFAKLLQGCNTKDMRVQFAAHFLRLEEWLPLKHFCSSVAGNAYTSLADGKSMDDVISSYLEQTDPVKYKQRTADIAAALFTQTRRALEETNALDLVVRKTAIVGTDVAAVWSAPQEKEVVSVENTENDPASVFARLIGDAEKQKKSAVHLEKINEQILKRAGDYETSVNSTSVINSRNKISMKGFLELVADKPITRIGMTVYGGSGSKICTASTEVNASKGAMEWINSSVAQKSMVEDKSLIAIASNNVVPHTELLLRSVVHSHIPPRYFEVKHIALVGEIAMIVPSCARMVRDLLHTAGNTPTILGGEIAGKYYGMSGAIRKVTQEIGLANDEEINSEDLAAGFLFSINDTFVLEFEDGSVDSYTIASSK